MEEVTGKVDLPTMDLCVYIYIYIHIYIYIYIFIYSKLFSDGLTMSS